MIDPDVTKIGDKLVDDITLELNNKKRPYMQTQEEKKSNGPVPNKNGEAMKAVDRQGEIDSFVVEGFVDQAIHARIIAVRGSYDTGPRDMYVRRMVLEAINSITVDNKVMKATAGETNV